MGPDPKKNTFLAKQESRYYTGTPDILAFLEEDEDKVLASIMHGNEVWKIDLNSGSAKHYNTYQGADYVFLDTDGKPAAYVSWDRSSGVYELKNRDKKTLIKTTNQNSMPYPVWGFTPDRSALLAFPDTETDYGLKQISLEDGSVSDIEIDGQAVGNVNDILDEYTNCLVGVGFTKDLYEQIFIDPEFRAVHTDLKSAFPDQTVWISSWSRDYSVMTIGVHSAGKPAEFYLYDSAGPSVSPLGSGAPQLQGRTLGTVENVSYQAADGLEIPAYVTLPPDKTREDGPFPLILMPHGGPEGRDSASFDWWSQAYAAAGYAVLQPNFRGSTGYGQKFRDAGHGEFGGKMITDSLDGAEWAIAEGIAKPGGYCIIGASYGGYAALQGAVLGGDKVRCAVSVNGVADPIRLTREYDNDSGAFSYWQKYMGIDRYSNDDAKRAITPKDRASEISAQILSLHGKEDTTVKYDQAEAIAYAMEGRSNFRLVAMEGEDHYLRSTRARETVLRESLSFLARELPVE